MATSATSARRPAAPHPPRRANPPWRTQRGACRAPLARATVPGLKGTRLGKSVLEHDRGDARRGDLHVLALVGARRVETAAGGDDHTRRAAVEVDGAPG